MQPVTSTDETSSETTTKPIGAGFFTADAALGFPPGTPASAHARDQVICDEYINDKKLIAI